MWHSEVTTVLHHHLSCGHMDGEVKLKIQTWSTVQHGSCEQRQPAVNVIYLIEINHHGFFWLKYTTFGTGQQGFLVTKLCALRI